MSLDVVALCKNLIAIDSINPFRTEISPTGEVVIDGKEEEILAYCEGLLQDAGFATRRQDCGGGRQNLIAEKGEGVVSLLLYGHVDTVEVKEGWTYEEALSPVVRTREVDGKAVETLVGLGSNDMKGGVAAMLCAAMKAEFDGYKLKVVLGCDEEFWSLGSHCLVHDSDVLDDVGLILVPELGESTVAPKPGEMLVTLGRCGRAELVIDVPGTGGHGAEPHRRDRVNAVTQAAYIAVAIEEYSHTLPVYYPFPGSQQHVESSALVTRIEGGQGLLSIPDKAQIIVNRVLVPGETPESAQDDLEDLLLQLRETGAIQPVSYGAQEHWPSVSIRPRPTPPLLPYCMDPQEPTIARALKRVKTHGPLQCGMGLSVADENRFGGEAKKPVLVIGPRGEDSHAAYEWVTIPSLHRLESTYLDLIQHGNTILPIETT
ncbi:MAG: M20 family peptidase [Deltaproteobacteria bacterium]|nr:MAG: M20 family peptidase [Deltaproteobacteria bacterium]